MSTISYIEYPKTREEAASTGASRYYTGVPCRRGHLDLRDTSYGNCQKCCKENGDKYKSKNREKNARKAQARRDARTPEQVDAVRRRDREFYHKNSTKIKKNAQDYRDANPEKSKAIQRKSYYKNFEKNRVVRLSRARANTIKRKSQRCSCCSTTDLNSFYTLSRKVGLEVDHIVPTGLGGLHCLKNLQLISHDEHTLKTKMDMRDIMASKKARG